MDNVIAQSMSLPRFNMLLLAAFAGLAILLVAVPSAAYGIDLMASHLGLCNRESK